MCRSSFVLYTDYWEIVKDLSDEDLGKLFRCIMTYQCDCEIPETNDAVLIAFRFIKSQLDRDSEKYHARCEKNKANAEKRWQQAKEEGKNLQSDKMRNDANASSRINSHSDNDNDNDNVNDNDKYIYCASCKEIIDYLNQKTGKNFSDKSDASRRLIKARLNEGRTVEDFKKVIDIKSKQWLKDEKMNRYLQPSTLFSTKFEGYLNEKEIIPVNGFAGRNYDFEGLEKQLLGY